MLGMYGKEVCILQKGDEVVLRCFMQCINCSHCPLGNKTPFLFCLSQLFRINRLLLENMPPLSDTDVLDHPGLNTSILESSTSSTFIQITTIHVFLQSLTYLFTTKGSPWDTEFRCPLVMPDLSQCLCSRVPPPHSALALYNDNVSWY